MKTNQIKKIDYGFEYRTFIHMRKNMDCEGLLISERIEEIMMMCDREHPIYEQISSFSIALYALGFFNCDDLMSFQDIDAHEAAVILSEHFTKIDQDDLPQDYNITESNEQYLLVVGDPLFPVHFAVLADTAVSRPFFSKLPFFGSGFDSLEELMDEFADIDGISSDDFHFFRKTSYGTIPSASIGKIYIVKNY